MCGPDFPCLTIIVLPDHRGRHLLSIGAWRWLPSSRTALRRTGAKFNNDEKLDPATGPPAQRTTATLAEDAIRGDEAMLHPHVARTAAQHPRLVSLSFQQFSFLLCRPTYARCPTSLNVHRGSQLTTNLYWQQGDGHPWQQCLPEASVLAP